MKRVAVIAIFMAVMASLFTFPSYAETDFNYATSVSNQDSINGVVITLKANRGSLVNSGTAALGYSGYCPVLITITLQNTNNQNVLINNLKFKVTTNSSGLFSRIVSFEQLSSDLIVAETPYDLNNYISIVPSNEYSYGTGIVVPANSSMYMVCLMNVYANYDTASNQWQVPSLQYIGYDQSITVTTGDYHSSGVPIDLSNVSSLLEELIDTVATDDQLTDLINSVRYTGTYYNYVPNNVNNNSRSVTLTSGNDTMYIYGSRTYSTSYLTAIDTITDNYTDIEIVNGTIKIPVMYYLFFRADVNSSMYLYYDVQNALPFSNSIFHIEWFKSDLFKNIEIVGTTLRFYFNRTYNATRTLIPAGSYYTILYGTIEVPLNTTLTWNTLSLGGSFYKEDGVYLPIDEYTILRDLYLSLVEKAVDDNTEEAQEMNDEIHDAEQVWYDNNSAALEQVGLSNYRFSQSQSSGITQAVTQFQAVWNALGQWTNVYIFILILSISTYIIRHEPTTRVKQYRSSVQAERAERISYYGRKNAELRAANSSGSTLKNAIRRRK